MGTLFGDGEKLKENSTAPRGQVLHLFILTPKKIAMKDTLP